MDWEKEAETINSYSDYEIENNKRGVLDYVEFILCINGEEYLFSNERKILKYLKVV